MTRSFKSVLLASAAAATLAVPALAESYFFRTKPLVDPPQAFSFTARTGQNPGAVLESAAAFVKGHRGKTLTISGGEYQICATSDCSGATWTSSPTTNVPAAFHARVRVTAAAFGEKAVARLAVGDAAATFEVGTRSKDISPDLLEFPSIGNAQPGVAAKSVAIAVKGHDGVTLSVENGGYQVCQTVACTEMDGKTVAIGTSGEVASGTLVRLFATPATYGATATATLRAGDTVGTFTATARGKDTTPGSFQFTAKGNQDPKDPNQPSYSAPVVLADFDGAPLSVTGGGYQICASADCSDQTGGFQIASMTEVLPGTRIRLVATPTGFGQKATATLTVGGVSASYEATARAKDETPDAISFPSKVDQAVGAEALSEVRQLANHDGVTVSVSGTGATLRVCSDGACGSPLTGWTNSASAARNQYVQLKVVVGASAETRTATLTYGTNSTATWAVSATAGVTVGQVGTMYAIADMGILDSSILSLLEGIWGTGKDWKLCATQSDYNSQFRSNCSGAASTLTVVNVPSIGRTFGAYASGTPRNGGFYGTSGFYFSGAPAFAGNRIHSNGSISPNPTVDYEPFDRGFHPFYLGSSANSGGVTLYPDNGNWQKGATLAGQSQSASYPPSAAQILVFRR